MVKWIKCNIAKLEYFRELKKKKNIVTHNSKDNLIVIMLNERIQMQMVYADGFYLYEVQEQAKQIHTGRGQNSGYLWGEIAWEGT